MDLTRFVCRRESGLWSAKRSWKNYSRTWSSVWTTERLRLHLLQRRRRNYSRIYRISRNSMFWRGADFWLNRNRHVFNLPIFTGSPWSSLHYFDAVAWVIERVPSSISGTMLRVVELPTPFCRPRCSKTGLPRKGIPTVKDVAPCVNILGLFWKSQIGAFVKIAVKLYKWCVK